MKAGELKYRWAVSRLLLVFVFTWSAGHPGGLPQPLSHNNILFLNFGPKCVSLIPCGEVNGKRELGSGPL
jgi:hypothetical protein